MTHACRGGISDRRVSVPIPSRDIQGTVVRVRVDFNRRESPHTIALGSSADTPEEARRVGALVVPYELGDIECEAIVRRGERPESLFVVASGVPQSAGERSSIAELLSSKQ